MRRNNFEIFHQLGPWGRRSTAGLFDAFKMPMRIPIRHWHRLSEAYTEFKLTGLRTSRFLANGYLVKEGPFLYFDCRVLRADFLTILIPSSSLGKSDETKDSAVASAPSPPWTFMRDSGNTHLPGSEWENERDRTKEIEREKSRYRDRWIQREMGCQPDRLAAGVGRVVV